MDSFIGTICAFGFNYPPLGWATCSGQIVSIQSNTALFALLGVAYGGNGTSTFGLPDLCGRAALGFGQGTGTSNYTMGEMGGAETETLTLANIPPHTHNVSVAIKVNAGGTGVNSPVGAYPGTDGSGGGLYASSPQTTPPPAIVMAPMTSPSQLQPAGGSSPLDIRRPYLAMNYSIATQGYFPARD